MSGLFDDLIPANPAGDAGLFDDLIPQQVSPAAASPVATDDLEKLYPSNAVTESMSTPGSLTLPDAADFADKVGQGFFLNFGDELAALAGSLPNTLTGGAYGKDRKTILREFREREKAFEKSHPISAMVGEVGGSLAGAVIPGVSVSRLMGAAPGLERTMGASALLSAPQGAIDATGRLEGEHTTGDYGAAAGQGAGIAGGIGALFGGAGKVAANVVGPWATDAAQRLTGRGIRLTPGELMGPNAKRAEDSLSSVPFVGDMLRTRSNEGIEDLNRVAINDALAPLGGPPLQRGAEMGRDAIAAAHDAVGDAYTAARAQMVGRFDPQLQAQLDGIVMSLPPAERTPFTQQLQHYLTRASGGTGDFNGVGIHDAIKAFRDQAQTAGRNPRPGMFDFENARAFNAAADALTDNMERHSAPGARAAFQNANEAFARLTAVERAAASSGSEAGIATPAQLAAGVKASDRSVRKNATSRGDALGQELTDDAKSVMSRRMADSGSPARAMAAGLLGSVGTGAFFTGMTTPAIGAAAGLLASQSAPAHRAFQYMATFSPQTRMMIRRAIERASGAGAPAAGLEVERQF